MMRAPRLAPLAPGAGFGRRDALAREGSVAHLEERKSESIHQYTCGAYALLREDRIGSIEKSKYADFIVLDRNLLEIPVDDISETEVLRTVFNGRTVHQKGER